MNIVEGLARQLTYSQASRSHLLGLRTSTQYTEYGAQISSSSTKILAELLPFWVAAEARIKTPCHLPIATNARTRYSLTGRRAGPSFGFMCGRVSSLVH